MSQRDKAKKEEEVTELGALDFVRSEVNLLIFPFFALTTKGLRDHLRTEFRAVAERDGKRAEISWTVSANSEYGYPGLFDRQVHRAVEQIISVILKADGQVDNPIPLGSLYSLCQRMGKTPSKDGTYSGYVYSSVKQALERITTTAIKSEGSFYHKGEQRWASEVFHLYDAVVFRGKYLRNGQIADSNYLYLSDLYLQSINSFYVKPLDYHYQQQLRSHIASRLYEILGVKFYGVRNRRDAKICFRYSTLTQLLPVKRYRYLAHAKKQLDPGHQELVDTGFLAGYEWEEAQDRGEWLIFYRPGKRARDEIRRAEVEHRAISNGQETLPGMNEQFEPELAEQPDAAELAPEEEEALIAELVRLNVSADTARELVASSAPETICRWTEAIHYSSAQDKAAFLVKAIRNNWQVPEEYLKFREQQEQQERLREKQLARELQEQQAERLRQQEAEILDQLYETLSAEQKTAIDRETEARIPPFVRQQISRRQKQGELSAATAAILHSRRREVLRNWLSDGKLGT